MTLSNRRSLLLSVVISLCLMSGVLYAQDKPLAEKDLQSLIQLQIDDAAIVAKLQKGGVSFAVDEAAIARLKTAGASETVIKALQGAASAKPAGGAPITYQDVLQLLSLGIDETAILERLAKSPTTFTPSAEEAAALKNAGASDRLLAALKAVRPLSPQVAELITDFAIVLDCSGSMKDLTPERETKMVAAKRVVTDLVQKMPEGLNVTFVIYGHEVFSASADDPRNCQAVKVARPLGQLNAAGKAELVSLISSLRPTGATPIALSLRTAGAELFKNNAFCGLVLITDGLETCHGDPVAEAARLAANPKLSFGVHVVGFGAKPEEDQALAQIAKAGRGKYYDANSSAELAKSIGFVFEDLARSTETKNVERRAVRVLQPQMPGFPPLGEIQLVSYGLGSVSIVGKGGYGEDIRVPSATTKYDVKWAPAGGVGEPVAMLKDHTFPERKLLVIKPEEHLGLLRVNGEGQVKDMIRVYQRGLGSIIVFQECKKFGETMVVPAGKYFIEVDGNEIEEGFEIVAGKMHVLE